MDDQLVSRDKGKAGQYCLRRRTLSSMWLLCRVTDSGWGGTRTCHLLMSCHVDVSQKEGHSKVRHRGKKHSEPIKSQELQLGTKHLKSLQGWVNTRMLFNHVRGMYLQVCFSILKQGPSSSVLLYHNSVVCLGCPWKRWGFINVLNSIFGGLLMPEISVLKNGKMACWFNANQIVFSPLPFCSVWPSFVQTHRTLFEILVKFPLSGGPNMFLWITGTYVKKCIHV